ncbi:MAG: hypothetical protein ACRCU3_04415 [Eubacteriaceae bacterium]
MIEKIAYYQNINSDEPNVDLAILLCDSEDRDGIREIRDGLTHKTPRVAANCIKILYEIGYRKPELISDYTKDFLSLLTSKNNRLVWGGMTALATIADLKPIILYQNIEVIKSAFQNGSVITIDQSITVFAKIAKADKTHEDELFSLLIDHLACCRPKEVPQHGDRASLCVHPGNSEVFIHTLEKRKPELTPNQIKRVDKIIKALSTEGSF